MEQKDKIRNYIIETFLLGASDNKFDDDDSFLEMGIIDSTGVLELVSFIENEFEIEVKDEELIPDNFDSLNKLLVYIENKK